MFVELLRKFPKHYKEGLFTPQNLLKLLVSVDAVAVMGDGEYLMPALMPSLKMSPRQQSASLVVWFPYGYIPTGLFCCLVSHLLSPTNPSTWKVFMKRDRPLCLYRDCVSLEGKGTAEIITLVDMFSYIEVHVSEASSEVCRDIRDSVHRGIKSACSVLKYHDVQFEDAFMCAGASCTSDPPHAAVVVCSRSPRGPVYKWKCSIEGDQIGDLSEDQLMWLGESAVSKDLSTSGEWSVCVCGRPFDHHLFHLCTVPLSLDSEPSLSALIDKVAVVIPHKYEMVGLQIGLTPGELQVIGPRHPKLEDYHRAFGEMFGVWKRRGSPPYTWGTIIDVLRTASVGEVLLSDQLTSWILHCDNTKDSTTSVVPVKP